MKIAATSPIGVTATGAFFQKEFAHGRNQN